MAGIIYRFNDGLAGMERQRAILSYQPPASGKAEGEKFDTPADENVVFKVENLRFSYADTPVIKDISFAVNKEEVVALVGQNGSGKTTLIKLLLNMFKPQSGSIEVLGRPYGDYKRGFLRSRIGVFFQNFWLFHMTLRENVAIGGIEDIEGHR